MTWTKQNTYPLMDRFQERTEQEVWKFNQIESGFNSYSLAIWIQSERDELENQFSVMEEYFLNLLGFYPRPVYKTIKIPIDYRYPYWTRKMSVSESAWLNGFGVRAVELVEAAVTYSIVGDDAVFTITTDVITEGELGAFHVSTDANGEVASDNYRLLPRKITYASGDYTVKIPLARLILPEKWETEYVGGDQAERQSYVRTTTANFASTLDFYRVYTDSTTKATLIGPPYSFTSDTALLSQSVNVTILDEEEASFVIQGSSDVTFEPTHVVLNAYIGYPLTGNGFMSSKIEEFMIRKAKVEMGINARLAAAKISTQWDFDELRAYDSPDANSGRGGVGFMPNGVGMRNVDVELFKSLYPIANWRGKIADKRFWR